jgi:hypothetical protein
VWTTRVSNPVCSPHFRVSASVASQETAFATGVPPDIYAFHRYTGNSISLSGTQGWQFQKHLLRLSRTISLLTYHSAYTPFTPSKSGQRLHLPYYRGCWHGISRCLLWGYRQARQMAGCSSPLTGVYDTKYLHPPRGVAASGFRPLRNIPHCCLP